jgi:rubrerythrin
MKETAIMNLFRTSVEILLGHAIRAEIDSSKIYSRIAARLKNPLLKEKFHFLASEEKKHRDVLEKLYALRYKGKKPEVPARTDEALLPAIRLSPASTLAEILYQAMAAEKAAQNFYSSLSGRVSEPALKKILSYLSKIENSHFQMLRGEYALAQSFEDYAEKDIDKVVT